MKKNKKNQAFSYKNNFFEYPDSAWQQRIKLLLSETGHIGVFTGETIRQSFSLPFELGEFLKQCYVVGNRSLFLVSITGMMLGWIFTVQSFSLFSGEVNSLSQQQMLAVLLIKEIGPLVTTLICAGKIASEIGAELARMRMTEQIDAMEVSASNPMKFLVATRVLATTFMIPVLVIFADALAFFGSWLALSMKSDITIFTFFAEAVSSVSNFDFTAALLKTFVFGALIGLIACYKGYHSNPDHQNAGRAANSAVVISFIAVIVFDTIAARLTEIFH